MLERRVHGTQRQRALHSSWICRSDLSYDSQLGAAAAAACIRPCARRISLCDCYNLNVDLIYTGLHRDPPDEDVLLQQKF